MTKGLRIVVNLCLAVASMVACVAVTRVGESEEWRAVFWGSIAVVIGTGCVAWGADDV